MKHICFKVEKRESNKKKKINTPYDTNKEMLRITPIRKYTSWNKTSNNKTKNRNNPPEKEIKHSDMENRSGISAVSAAQVPAGAVDPSRRERERERRLASIALASFLHHLLVSCSSFFVPRSSSTTHDPDKAFG